MYEIQFYDKNDDVWVCAETGFGMLDNAIPEAERRMNQYKYKYKIVRLNGGKSDVVWRSPEVEYKYGDKPWHFLAVSGWFSVVMIVVILCKVLIDLAEISVKIDKIFDALAK